MTVHHLRILVLGTLLTVLASCFPPSPKGTRPAGGATSSSDAPPAPREFRGVWVASVGNVTWPRDAGLSVEQQKRDAIALLDRCAAVNINAVFLQVRPSADALYASKIEPWSEYLTGVQGRPPTPFYDPLQFWIEQAHQRGIELHAWFNPFRVRAEGAKSSAATNSVVRTRPELVKAYGPYLWMDPGEAGAQQRTVDVILDVVRRYDVDGVHTDDYYYPYPIKDRGGQPIAFPDDPSWKRFRRGVGNLSREDWRRDNINQLVRRIYGSVHQVKPWVRVSYAPFGIWRPNNPPGIQGMDAYDSLYADARLWLNQGWLDFMSPQLYWKIGGPQDFKALLGWWLQQNAKQRYVWPGMSVGRHPTQEILSQIAIARQQPLSNGQMMWSAADVVGEAASAHQLADALQRGPYVQKALVPAFPWLDSTHPAAPMVTAERINNGIHVKLRSGSGERAWLYAVHIRYGRAWQFTVVPGGSPGVTLNADPTGASPDAVVVTAVDRCGNESPRVRATSR